MSEYKLPLDKLIPALIKFQSEVPPIPKDKENPFFKNKDTGKKAMYADLATIIETIRAPLSGNGLCITQPVCGDVLETYLYHSSGQYIKSEMKINNEKNNAQGFGSGLTYARRYALSSILGITADEDDDGNGASKTGDTNTPPQKNNPTPANSGAKNPCSEAQQRRIETLWQELGRTEAALKKELQKTFKVDSVALLGVTDAVAVIKSLTKLVDEHNAEKEQMHREAISELEPTNS